MWADGFRSMYTYIEQRAAFIVVSPDKPETQKTNKEKRGWKFRMATYGDSTLAKDMGFSQEKDGKTFYLPGFSVFRKDAKGGITRIGWDFFGPGDDYNCVFSFFRHLPPMKEGEWFNPDMNGALPK